MEALTRIPRTQLLVVTSVVILAAMFFANSMYDGDDSDLGGWLGLSAFGIALTVLLLLVVVPRIPREHQRNAVLGFGIGAVVTLVIVWSTLPFALGAAALYAAGPGEVQVEGEKPAPVTAGVILALLAWIAGFVACIIG